MVHGLLGTRKDRRKRRRRRVFRQSIYHLSCPCGHLVTPAGITLEGYLPYGLRPLDKRYNFLFLVYLWTVATLIKSITRRHRYASHDGPKSEWKKAGMPMFGQTKGGQRTACGGQSQGQLTCECSFLRQGGGCSARSFIHRRRTIPVARPKPALAPWPAHLPEIFLWAGVINPNSPSHCVFLKRLTHTHPHHPPPTALLYTVSSRTFQNRKAPKKYRKSQENPSRRSPPTTHSSVTHPPSRFTATLLPG